MEERADRRWLLALWTSLAVIAMLSITLLPPTLEGDTPSYIEAMSVLRDGQTPSDFVPNRILTTFGGLTAVTALSEMFGVWGGWILLNLSLYFTLCVAFYYLVLQVFKSYVTALLSTLILAANYSLLQFGLTYLMDIGGWAFYILSLYFSYRYIESGAYKHLLYASVAVGVGALFKEYALLATIPIAVILIWKYRRSPLKILRRAITPTILALLPLALVYACVFKSFNYSYIDWLSFNQGYYTYPSRVVEYIKSLGSLYNFSSLLVLGGVCILVRQGRELDSRAKLFMSGVLISILPAFFWPAITQRIMFVTVPAMLLITAVFIRKYEKHWLYFTPIVALYTLSSFAMDAYILPNLNLPF